MTHESNDGRFEIDTKDGKQVEATLNRMHVEICEAWREWATAPPQRRRELEIIIKIETLNMQGLQARIAADEAKSMLHGRRPPRRFSRSSCGQILVALLAGKKGGSETEQIFPPAGAC